MSVGSQAAFKRTKKQSKSKRILQPAESTLDRLIGEQRQRAQEVIYERIAAALPSSLTDVFDELLHVLPGQKVSLLQRLKANPRNPSPEAMLALLQTLKVIEATGVLLTDPLIFLFEV